MDFKRRVPLNQPLPWLVAMGLFIFSILFFAPFGTSASDPSHDRLAFEGKTDRPLEWVEMCLGKDWGGRLSLRHRKAPSQSVARLDNPVRHYVVDIVDEGVVRQMRAYSRHGEAFTKREIEALDGCLTGRAFSLADPRNR
ncbi:hypothetical protein [Sphingobium yanoikuyae]|uniref:hypothetical protein n=1 Tax=Sphingobium yanoikuyae TaxID=13690 RepID=UPI0012DAC710|nr:hypothetical protein [Sphingobium yanoikuyae]